MQNYKKLRNISKKIKKVIPFYKDYMGMYCFLQTRGLYDEFLKFYDNFSLEKIDDYKQKERLKDKEVDSKLTEINLP